MPPARRAAGLKFGGVWTGVIVTQVAVTVVFLAIVGVLGWSAYVTNGGERAALFRPADYVAMRLLLDRVRPRTRREQAKQSEAGVPPSLPRDL